jgi:hypothetical protein
MGFPSVSVVFVEESPELLAGGLIFRRRQAEGLLHLPGRHLLNPADDHRRNSVIVLEAVLNVVSDRIEPLALLFREASIHGVGNIPGELIREIYLLPFLVKLRPRQPGYITAVLAPVIADLTSHRVLKADLDWNADRPGANALDEP